MIYMIEIKVLSDRVRGAGRVSARSHDLLFTTGLPGQMCILFREVALLLAKSGVDMCR